MRSIQSCAIRVESTIAWRLILDEKQQKGVSCILQAFGRSEQSSRVARSHYPKAVPATCRCSRRQASRAALYGTLAWDPWLGIRGVSSNYALKGTLRTSREFPGRLVGAGPLNAALGNRVEP